MLSLVQKMHSALTALKKDEKGATAIEYGLIAAFIALAIIISVGLLGNSLGNMFSNVANELA